MLRYFEGNSWNSPIFATMITTARYLLTLLCISLFFGKVAIGQEVTIELGADQLGDAGVWPMPRVRQRRDGPGR